MLKNREHLSKKLSKTIWKTSSRLIEGNFDKQDEKFSSEIPSQFAQIWEYL